MTSARMWVGICVVLGLMTGTAHAALPITMETVPVGNAGNPADNTGYGMVSYAYEIGKFEVTAGQYTEFLNAVAADDTYLLYNRDVLLGFYGCYIARHGTPGSYTYTVADLSSNFPVNFVSWGDAARFANWLHNGQPVGPQGPGTTETGSYALNGATTNEALMAIQREPGATWVIPTENEWYKAAYHKNDGVTGNYFDYPTSSDVLPDNSPQLPDTGNNANINGTYGFPVNFPHELTPVGRFENSGSPYSTFDQCGNVWEWSETDYAEDGSSRALRGGGYPSYFHQLSSAYRIYAPPVGEYSDFGFRVALVPEPGTILLVGLASLGILRKGR